jgi:DeoR family transcriptional regulator of aga operon
MGENRQQKILEILADQDSVNVLALSERFGVSPVTIRTDLNQLAEMGKVSRMHGGARLADERMRQELTYVARQKINAEQKRCIGIAAAALVSSEEAIVLDSSTTAVAVGVALKGRDDLENVTVVTTGLWTALELLGCPHIQVVLTGGQIRDTTGSITGVFTDEVLSRFYFSKAFLGAWGLTLDSGLTDIHLQEIELKQKIMTRSEHVNIVVDGAKFGRRALSTYAAFDQVSQIFTDTTAPSEMVAELRDNGVQVQVTCTPGVMDG